MHLIKKAKKRRIFFLLLMIIFLFYIGLRSKNYEKKYTVNNVSITERYLKKEREYQFVFEVEGHTFFVPIARKYMHKKSFVKNIEVRKNDDTICIFPESVQFSFMPLCKKNNEYISYHLIEEEDIVSKDYKKEYLEDENFGNLKLYHLNHHKYYIWNYKGFWVMDEDNQKEISLFTNDVYTIPLATQVGDFLLLADYNSRFVFQKFYVISSKNDKVRELLLPSELPYESYFLGSTSKKVYLVDKKNKKEYEIYPKRLSITNVTQNNKGKILVNGAWESIGMQSLIAKEEKFSFKKSISYVLEDEVLYAITMQNKTKVSNQKVKEIVYQNTDEVYYIVDDKLYYYNVFEGEVLVMSYFEWNFNYKNMIYVF